MKGYSQDFIKDRIDKKEIAVEYCPTHLMVADFFTKPLQGRMFKFFRDVVMGYKTMEEILFDISIKERVEDKNKNRIVSENSKQVIEKSRCDVRARAHDKTTATSDEINKMKKQVTWKDEMKKTSN